jgi:hypothetical protein
MFINFLDHNLSSVEHISAKKIQAKNWSRMKNNAAPKHWLQL